MRDYEDQIRDAGASIAAIGLGDRYYGAAFRSESRITFPLLIDEERAAYKAAGLKTGSLLGAIAPSNIAAAMAKRAAGYRQRRMGQNPFQLGATFVFGPDDTLLFAHINDTYSDFASSEDVLRVLRKWRA